MPTYVSLLRGVNVGGRNQIAMGALRTVYESQGHRDVVTYVQSGNVVSTTPAKRPTDVAQPLERAIADDLGLDVVVLVRTPAELRRVFAGNPFVSQHDPRKLLVTFLSARPVRALLDGIDNQKYSPDEFAAVGREIYVHCPTGYGRSKINNTFFERRLGVTATTRNWKTVGQLVDLVAR